MGVKIRQKIKGKGQPWWVFISHNGKRTSRKVGSKDAAVKVAQKLEAQLKLGEFGFEKEKPIPTFGDYAKLWIQNTVPATCKPSTAKDYRDILDNHVYSVFKNVRVDEITRGKVRDFLLSKINDGYAKSTVAHFRNVVSGVLGKALDDEVIPANPALNVGKISQRNDKKGDINPLTAKELKILLDTVKKHYPDHYVLFLLLAQTGMRIGEAIALQWGDIDFNGRFIEVKRSLVRGQISTPKSGKSRRVDMSKQLAAALKDYRHQSKKKGLSLGIGGAPEFIFTNKRGNPIDKDSWRRRVFVKALEKAGIRRIRIHDLRHTYATLRISKGDNIADVSNQLGHHSVKLTMDVYYHWIPGKKKSEVDELDDQGYQGISEVSTV